jgi:hypothetical protein
LDRQKGRKKHITDSSSKKEIQKWLKSRKYMRKELLSGIRDASWRKKININNEIQKNIPYTKLQKNTLLFKIPSIIISLL